ncbi:hypothetical protein S83_032976, partial [Arachis hypogaea]
MTPSPATRLLCSSSKLSATSSRRSASTTRHSPHHHIQSSAPLTGLPPSLPLLCSTLVAPSLQVSLFSARRSSLHLQVSLFSARLSSLHPSRSRVQSC